MLDKTALIQKKVEVILRGIIVEQLGIPEEAIGPASRLSDDFGADSLDIIEFIMEFEDQINLDSSLEISDEVTKNWHTLTLEELIDRIADASNLVERTNSV